MQSISPIPLIFEPFSLNSVQKFDKRSFRSGAREKTPLTLIDPSHIVYFTFILFRFIIEESDSKIFSFRWGITRKRHLLRIPNPPNYLT